MAEEVDATGPAGDLEPALDASIKELRRAVEELSAAVARMDARSEKTERTLDSLVQQTFNWVHAIGRGPSRPPSLLTVIAPPSINLALSFLGFSNAVQRPEPAEPER
jgi:hypothetical protein